MTSIYDTVRYRSLEDKSVLITGGANGIGAAMVEAFAVQGAKVAFLDVDVVAGKALAQRTGARFVSCDLLDIDALRTAVREVEAAQDGVSVLINNAAKGRPPELCHPGACRLAPVVGVESRPPVFRQPGRFRGDDAAGAAGRLSCWGPSHG